MADSCVLLIPEHCTIVIYKAAHQRAQLSGMSPQICRGKSCCCFYIWGEELKRSMLLPCLLFSYLTSSKANPRHSVMLFLHSCLSLTSLESRPTFYEYSLRLTLRGHTASNSLSHCFTVDIVICQFIRHRRTLGRRTWPEKGTRGKLISTLHISWVRPDLDTSENSMVSFCSKWARTKMQCLLALSK